MCFACAGARVEIGQFLKPDVELQRAALDRDGIYLFPPGVIGIATEQGQRGPRICIGHDDQSMDLIAALEQDSCSRDYLGYPNARRDYGTGLLCRVGKIERDHAHTAFYISPSTW